jgi:hypothetical protein
LTDKIIEIYHNYKSSDSHKSDWEVEKLGLEEGALDEKYCVSTRIRVARNLKDFPLGTFLERDQRLKIE